MTTEDQAIVNRINFSECLQWRMDGDSLFHTSRHYFSVLALRCDGEEYVMINQPEVGLLGYIVAREATDTYWLVQMKMEPGNVELLQAAPSVQATPSNYQRVHGGRPTPYLELFKDKTVTFDVENSEQGDRFLNKFNRNAKYLLNERIAIEECLQDQFRWLTSREIRKLLRQDYAINTDSRSVVTCGGWHLLSGREQEIFLNDELPQELAVALNRSYLYRDDFRLPAARDILKEVADNGLPACERIPFSEMQQHAFEEDGIYDADHRRVIGYFDVNLPSREVGCWQQPLLESTDNAHCVLLLKMAGGIAYIGLKAYPEVGFTGRAEYGPTLQTGSGRDKNSAAEIDAILDKARVLLDVWQSDEGGRFYHNICRYTLAWLVDDTSETDPRTQWLSAHEIEALSLQRGHLSNEVRTSLSLLLSFA